MNAMIGNSLLLGGEGYQISRSVRLRSSASAYLSRTFSSGTRTTWTWSSWVKRGAVGVVYPTTNYAQALFGLNDSDKIYFYEDSLWLYLGTGATYTAQPVDKFRDPSAWYHIVVVLDTTNATSADRIRLYVNNRRITVSGTMPTQNWASSNFNSAINHNIGKGDNANGYFFDGYLTEINFIDGQALTPSSFGETNPVTGVWQPKKYTGTYGTNGFYLNFSDNSAATAAAIGKDYSGNGNNWTPNNISVTAGATYDSMLDVPTQWADGGNGRGNYCTLNPLEKAPNNYTFSEGNLAVSGSGAGSFGAGSSISVTSGKWYWEQTLIAKAATDSANAGVREIAGNSLAAGAFNGGVAGSYIYRSDAFKRNNGTSSSYGASFTAGDLIGVALDLDGGTLTFYKNGTSQGTAYSGLAGTFEAIGSGDQASGTTSYAFNFGQRPFAYTPPTGFKALNTLNLPTPTILKGNQYFDATIYTGSTGTNNIVNSGNMAPDLVWVKNRQQLYSHYLFDVVRGTGVKALSSNNTSVEGADGTAITSFNSNGFTFTGNSGANDPTFANAYIGWQWKANGTPAVTNTAGTITSTVSVGATQGFSVVTYTGNGVTGATVGHGLGVVPEFIIWKRRNATSNWISYNKTSGNGFSLYLDLTNANTASSYLNSTNPNSSVITMGTNTDNNGNGGTYVAYCFASVAGYSAFGSYTGNGSADGPMVFTGFQPRFVMMKAIDATNANDWVIIDTTRKTSNNNGVGLRPNLSNAEFDDSGVTTNGINIDVLSNGFKPRGTSTRINGSGSTVIYAAFASSPFKNSLAF